MEKIKLKEVIIVEGRDDTAAIKKAVDALTIETHGFGITKETWSTIEKAYETNGIIIFTDPDYSGGEIRKKLLKRFPQAKEAFLTKDNATKNGDIGIENASPESIIYALKRARGTVDDTIKSDAFTEQDLINGSMIGSENSRERRREIGKILGIGYSNGKTLLNKLNKFNISKEEFYEAIRTINNKGY